MGFEVNHSIFTFAIDLYIIDIIKVQYSKKCFFILSFHTKFM